MPRLCRYGDRAGILTARSHEGVGGIREGFDGDTDIRGSVRCKSSVAVTSGVSVFSRAYPPEDRQIGQVIS